MVEGDGVKWTDEVLKGMNEGDHSIIMQYIDEETVINIGSHNLLPFAGTYIGKKGMMEYSTIMKMSQKEDSEGEWKCTLVGSDFKTGVLSCDSTNFTWKKTGKTADFLDITIIYDWNVATGMLKGVQGFSGDSEKGIEAFLTNSELNVEMLKKMMVTDMMKKGEGEVADLDTLSMIHEDVVIEITNLYPSSLNIKIEGKTQLIDMIDSMRKKDFTESALPETTLMQMKALKLLMKKPDTCPDKRYLPSSDGETTAVIQSGEMKLVTMVFDEEKKLKLVSVKLDQNLVKLSNMHKNMKEKE
jgi:hypothetical protein